MSRRVAIVGCGAVGQIRAKTLVNAELVICADLKPAAAESLAASVPGCEVVADWREAVRSEVVDIVVVATPHNALTEVTAAAIAEGCHVLVEKPAARTANELRPLVQLADAKGVLVRVGYNHRYHRAFQKARQIIDSGELGPSLFLRARYGHGGRLGYDQEWRAQPAVSGGGELIDQGVHLVDLARWFLGEFVEVDGFIHTYFWDMPVEDNAFLMLKTIDQRVAFLHASCTEWKNTFSLELYGRNGKLQVDGLGGSYGVERLTWYRMLPEMGPPETTTWEYPMADNSWAVEMNEFFRDLDLGRSPVPGLKDALAVLEVVDTIYRHSQSDHRT